MGASPDFTAAFMEYEGQTNVVELCRGLGGECSSVGNAAAGPSAVDNRLARPLKVAGVDRVGLLVGWRTCSSPASPRAAAPCSTDGLGLTA